MEGPELFLLFKRFPSISTDTRKIKEGDLFFALKGDRFDGNKYAEQALEKGAARAIIDDPQYAKEGDERYVLVENVLKALQVLANTYRKSLSIPVLGITGSNGKTTTKELISSVLSTEKKVFATQGNLNNHIGVPLSLLRIPADAEIGIIEMGTNQPGDIQELVEIAEPDLGLITNIGSAHLERLGSVAGIRVEKGALFRLVMKQGGRIFLNKGDEHLNLIIGDYTNIVSYGSPEADYRFEIQSNEASGMEILVHAKNWVSSYRFTLQLSGSYNALNALAAITVAEHFGLSRENIAKGLASYVSSNNRSQMLERENYQIYLDAYNANPSSMKASIENIFEISTGKVSLILGDMFELGEREVEMHAELGSMINTHAPYRCIGLGKLMKAAVDQIEQNAYWFESVDDAQKEIQGLIEGSDLVMIKGSRGMALERLLDKI
ncbi:MAG: UDP-N-acetylmuramoyl-tripeptide--D-alanyl-D-alanine ligase [Bacteroidota bacterium]